MLVGSSEIYLTLRGGALRGRNEAGRCVAAHVGRSAQQNSGQHGGYGDHAATLTIVDGASDMTLRNVRHFVRQHPGQLALGIAREQQPGIDADVSAG